MAKRLPMGRWGVKTKPQLNYFINQIIKTQLYTLSYLFEGKLDNAQLNKVKLNFLFTSLT